MNSPSARRRIPPMARHGSVLNARAAARLSDEVDGSEWRLGQAVLPCQKNRLCGSAWLTLVDPRKKEKNRERVESESRVTGMFAIAVAKRSEIVADLAIAMRMMINFYDDDG